MATLNRSPNPSKRKTPKRPLHILQRDLAQNVRKARDDLGLPVVACAKRARLHWRHWQKVEAAEVNVTMHTLARLGGALGIDPATLIRRPAPADR